MTAMLGWFSLEDDAPPGEADRILARLTASLADAGLRLAGAVQVNTDRGADCACDMDVLVIGEEDAPGLGRIGRLERTIHVRAQADPNDSWTARLIAQGPNRAAQKVGEEGVETALAGAAGDNAELASEAADLIYHLLVDRKSVV